MHPVHGREAQTRTIEAMSSFRMRISHSRFVTETSGQVCEWRCLKMKAALVLLAGTCILLALLSAYRHGATKTYRASSSLTVAPVAFGTLGFILGYAISLQ